MHCLHHECSLFCGIKLNKIKHSYLCGLHVRNYIEIYFVFLFVIVIYYYLFINLNVVYHYLFT